MKRTQLFTVQAKILRQQQTKPESIVWEWLRAKRLQNCKFYRQYPCGIYTLDFYCPKLKLAIELDGAQHGDEKQILHDKKRTGYLNSFHITVLRLWNDQVTSQPDAAYDFLENYIFQLIHTPLS